MPKYPDFNLDVQVLNSADTKDQLTAVYTVYCKTDYSSYVSIDLRCPAVVICCDY